VAISPFSGAETQPDRDAKSNRTMRARQEMNNVKNLFFNIREPPVTIFLSLFAASNVVSIGSILSNYNPCVTKYLGNPG
jgi:hypothetical protein